jgi:hypothetical protein
MYHHSEKDYNTSASEAAALARTKMEDLVNNGRTQAAGVIEKISTTVIDDFLAPSNVIKFRPDTDGNMELVAETSKSQIIKKLHRNALYQAASIGKAPNPQRFIDWFYDNNAQDLLGQSLTKEFSNHEQRRHLIRSVGDESRAILSNSFKRIDARLMLEKYVEACEAIGALPYEGYVEDTRLVIRAILPMVFEPVANEVMLFGIEWYTSDFGHGANTIRLFNMRMWCTNLAMLNDVLRQIHLGKRLDENINFSPETYLAESNMMSLMMRDVIQNCLAPARIDAYLKGIKEASEAEIKGKDVKGLLRKHGLTTDQAQEVTDEFTSGEIEMLPPGQNLWRLSNALSWVANTKEQTDEKFLFQKAAGKILPVVDIKPVEVKL